MNIQGIAIAVLAIGFAAPAVAHEFDAAVVSPFANDSEIGNEILQGLVFAASERDAHSGMTSDGHLGGVDANFKLVDSAEGLDLVVNNLTAFDAPIVFLTGPADWQAALAEALPDAAIFVPGQQPAEGDPAVDDTARRFLADTGSEMNAPARMGYNAGRRIDLAVSPLDGVVPAQALGDAFAQSASGIDWGADF
ncbi:MAG: hypothetical protein N2B03_02040 [Boseongicola sp.]